MGVVAPRAPFVKSFRNHLLATINLGVSSWIAKSQVSASREVSKDEL